MFLTAAAPLRAELTEEQKNEMKEDVKNFKYQSVQTDNGLNFRVPEDMPIEKRNGIQAPIPFDEYMYGKFKQLDTRLENIDKKLERLEKIFYPSTEPKPEIKPSVFKSEEKIPVEKQQS